MSKFSVYGPYEIEYEIINKMKSIQKPGKNFWQKNSEFLNQQGCYIFAVKTKSLTPYYVGLATKSFKQEIFTPHKLVKYNNVLLNYQKGKPVLFLVCHPKQKGKKNQTQIVEIENFLIQVGMTVNPEIKNIRGTKKPQWEIKNVLRSGSGRPNKAEKAFKKMLSI